MELRQLRYFAAAVEEGTISAAARKLHLSQPPLSMQIRELEEELGTILFERGARQIVLTDSGRALYRYASEMLELERDAREDLKSFSQGRAGSVRVGLISTAESKELWEGIRKFRALCPRVQLLLYDAPTMELLEMIRLAKIELAFIRTPYPTHDFDTVQIRCDSFCAVGKADLLRGRGKIRLEELSASPLVTYRRRADMVRSAFAAKNLPINLIGIADDARTALQFAENGIGTALVPESAASFLGGMKIRRINADTLNTELSLIKRKDTLVSQAAKTLFQVFVDLKRREAGGQGKESGGGRT